jgi:hypothetical protein
MTPAILKSDKLTELLQSLETQKSNAKQSRAEVWRMMKLQSPQIQDATVTRVTDADEPTAAFIGFKRPRDKPGVVFTGTEDKNEAALKDERLRRTLANEPLTDATDIKEQLAKEHRQWAAYESAIEFLTREVDREKAILSKEYCNKIQPKEKELMQRVGKHMLELHAAYSEAYNLKCQLIDNEIGCYGVFLDLPVFLSTPSNKHSEMADWLRAIQHKNYIKEVPSELRL